MTPEQAKALREPFKPEQIGKLPKPTKKENPKGRCAECGGWHGLPAVHLDYVGHAAITDRLLQVDPDWTWKPMAVDAAGAPLFSGGGLWILLTVAGVTRPGYGDETGSGGTKEIIGDALRNAAMRFGVGLDLWSKEGLGNEIASADEVRGRQQTGSARGTYGGMEAHRGVSSGEVAGGASTYEPSEGTLSIDGRGTTVTSDGPACPECGRLPLGKRRDGSGYFCPAGRDGCGKGFGIDDPRLLTKTGPAEGASAIGSGGSSGEWSGDRTEKVGGASNSSKVRGGSGTPDGGDAASSERHPETLLSEKGVGSGYLSDEDVPF